MNAFELEYLGKIATVHRTIVKAIRYRMLNIEIYNAQMWLCKLMYGCMNVGLHSYGQNS